MVSCVLFCQRHAGKQNKAAINRDTTGLISFNMRWSAIHIHVAFRFTSVTTSAGFLTSGSSRGDVDEKPYSTRLLITIDHASKHHSLTSRQDKDEYITSRLT